MTQHHVQFYRCADEPGLHRAICTCGWSMQGELETLQARSGSHNLDELKEPPLRQKGFVSGIPDWR